MASELPSVSSADTPGDEKCLKEPLYGAVCARATPCDPQLWMNDFPSQEVNLEFPEASAEQRKVMLGSLMVSRLGKNGPHSNNSMSMPPPTVLLSGEAQAREFLGLEGGWTAGPSTFSFSSFHPGCLVLDQLPPGKC